VFDNLKMMSAMAGLMKNKDALRQAGQRVRDKMASTRVAGEAGSGAARAVVSGEMRVLSIDLAPGLVLGMAADEKTRALAGTLIAEAVNQGLARAQAALKQAIDEEARALGLEGALPDMASLLGG
jgi:DNA-binding protein YbaB